MVVEEAVFESVACKLTFDRLLLEEVMSHSYNAVRRPGIYYDVLQIL